LRPLVGEKRLLWREYLDSHVASFSKEGTLLLDVSIRPSKEFDNGTLLSTFVVVRLIDLRSLPDKIGFLNSDWELTIIGKGNDNKSKVIFEVRVN